MCSVYLVIFSQTLVDLVWGSQFDKAAEILPILLIAVLFTTLGVPSVVSLTSRAHRGMVVATITSAIGMGIGAVSWVLLAPPFGITGIAIGYLIGTALIAGIPAVLVWRADNHHWAALALKLCLALAVLGGTFAFQSMSGRGLWAEAAAGAVFICGWSILMKSESLGLIRFVASKSRSRQHRLPHEET